jgi:spore coat protein U-like protein
MADLLLRLRPSLRALLRCAPAAFALVFAPTTVGPALAGNSPVNMQVTATVAVNCTFTTTPTLPFGSYDPVVTNASNPLDQTASFQLVCTKNAAFWIGLDPGQNAASAPAGVTRAMKSGTNFIGYELYRDTGRTQVWGNTQATGLSGVSPGITTKINGTIYGRVPAAQDVPGGSYADTVVVTVNF